MLQWDSRKAVVIEGIKYRGISGEALRAEAG